MRKLYSILSVGVLVLLIALMFFGCRSKEVESALIYINQQNDWEKAMEQLKMAVQVNPADVEAHVLLGEGYGHFGEYDKMAEEFATAEKLMQGAPDPKFKQKIEILRDKYWVKSFNFGVKQVQKDSLKLAEKSFKECIVINEDRADAYKNLGYVYLREGENDKAIEYYEKGLELAPDDIKALNALSDLYLRGEQHDKVIEVADRILANDPDNASAIALKALAYDMSNQTDKAFEAYEEALEKNPDNIDLIFNQGRLYFNKNEYEKAIENFKKVLEKNPDDIGATSSIGLSYLKIAENLLTPYRDMSDKELYDAVEQYEADLAKAKEQYKLAIPYLEKAVVLTPDNSANWTNLGIAYVQAGQSDRGEKCFAIADEVAEGNYLNAGKFVEENLSEM